MLKKSEEILFLWYTNTMTSLWLQLHSSGRTATHSFNMEKRSQTLCNCRANWTVALRFHPSKSVSLDRQRMWQIVTFMIAVIIQTSPWRASFSKHAPRSEKTEAVPSGFPSRAWTVVRTWSHVRVLNTLAAKLGILAMWLTFLDIAGNSSALPCRFLFIVSWRFASVFPIPTLTHFLVS